MQVHLRDFETHENVWKICWALFVIFKVNFTKTAIKTKFVDRFFKNFFKYIN